MSWPCVPTIIYVSAILTSHLNHSANRSIFRVAVTISSISVPDSFVRIVFSSKSYADNINQELNDLIGTTGLPIKSGKYSPENSIKEDRKVILNKKNYEFLKVCRFNNKLHIFILNKIPIINPDTMNVVGILGLFKPIGMCSLSREIVNSFSDSFKTKTRFLNTVRLSKREKQVIFLFLSNLSSQEIANTLSQIDNKTISKNTVDSIFADQLFIKFNAVSRASLREILIAQGFNKVIPKELLIEISIPLKELNTY